MRQSLVAELEPECPVCRPGDGGPAARLEWGPLVQVDGDHVVEGTLLCTRATCRREFPIIDGVPLCLASIRAYVQEQWPSLLARRDLNESTLSLLGDCCGPNSTFDHLRQQLSSYAWDHYGSSDPQPASSAAVPGSAARLVDRALELSGGLPQGPMLEVGTAVGGVARHLAGLQNQPVLGIDLNFGFLRLAAEVLRTNRVRYALRRVGLVYDERSYPLAERPVAPLDYWAADLGALPLRAGSFGSAVALNVLDSTGDPPAFFRNLAWAVRPGGKALIACPYDWAVAATALESWLGGHSQRGPDRGASEPMVRRLATSPGVDGTPLWTILAEQERVSWEVRLHERSHMAYQSHLLVLERTNAAL